MSLRKRQITSSSSVSLPYGIDDSIRKNVSQSNGFKSFAETKTHTSRRPVEFKNQYQSTKREEQNDAHRTIIRICIGAVIMLIIACSGELMSIKTKNKALKEAAESLLWIKYDATESQEKVKHLQMMVEQLKQDNHALNVKLNQTNEDRNKVIHFFQSRDEELDNRFRRLHKEIQHMSRLETVERFGKGPHLVEFKIKISSQVTTNDREASFVVELAPIHIMPHSVNMFLHTVDLKIWDDSLFYHTAHLLGGVPNAKRQAMPDVDFSALSFQEYSVDYPHHKYTLGFAGRPGGPEFYINSEDNARIHGPGGQTHHVLGEEADPCFGKVIEGFDVVDRLFVINMMDNPRPTQIISARLLQIEDA
eukprot:CAMPEP_0172513724 /NCGR_PEP_ID=MMETSP1066-20121228/254754_1 /TAXON_ID=671091 /ORGANISM="Coscinodiscus wailesii, Strain CCMP2513" /LENGTH=362 /DNA_ID=CAMNT_0013294111 /DNA_START=66 /DNA_END=1154 /DNA_ORIENTATION=+